MTEIVEYMGKDLFVKFTNVDDFPSLNAETKDLLKNWGLFSSSNLNPFLTTDGVLRLLDNGLIQVGKGTLDNLFLIDADNKLLIQSLNQNVILIVNSSIRQYIETVYQYRKFTKEIEWEETLGDYWENHKLYAKTLQDILEKVEPEIMSTLWYSSIEERRLGVI